MLQFTAIDQPSFTDTKTARIIATGEIYHNGKIVFSNVLGTTTPERSVIRDRVSRNLLRYRAMYAGQAYNVWNEETGLAIETR